MKMCRECGAENARGTPVLGARECLENHTQYVCGSCGRCICVEKEPRRGLQRWNFPFRSLAAAKLYLRAADVSTRHRCGIYELCDGKGRVFYKIFEDVDALRVYLAKNKGKQCVAEQPIFQADAYAPFEEGRVRWLAREEVERYLEEQRAAGTGKR